jgi:hypothetical protein
VQFSVTGFFNKQTVYSALTAGLFSFLIAFVLDASVSSLILLACVGGVFGLLVRDSVAVFCGFLLSFVVCTVAALVAGALFPTYSISGALVLAGFLSVTVAIAFGMRRFTIKTDESKILVAVAALTASLLFLLRESRTWTSVNAFGALVRGGEDNAAWLLALSRSVIDGKTEFSSASGTSGGPGTGIVINLVRQSMSAVGESPLLSSGDNALVLVRAYAVVAVLLACGWLVVSVVASSSRDPLSRKLFAVLVSATSYVFVMGLANVGHFSAVVAVLFLSIAMFIYLAIDGSSKQGMWVKRLFVVLALVAAGQSWFPLTGLALLYVFALMVIAVAPYMKQRPDQKTIRLLIAVGIAVTLFSYFSYTRLFASFLQNAFSLDYIIRNLTIPGGYSTVNPWLVVLGFIAVTWWGFSKKDSDRDTSHWVLPLLFVVPTVLLFVWSYFLAPFTPQYGAWKYLYIATAVTVPLTVVILQSSLPDRTPIRFVRVLPVLVLFALTMFSPPWNSIQWAEGIKGTDAPWVAGVVKALQVSPERPVACVNTVLNDESRNYEAYLCSRMSFGLGGFDEYVHRTWTAANICQIPPPQARAEFSREFQQDLSVLLFDGTRTSSFAGCQAPAKEEPNGWLSSINWDVVRKLDSTGKVVNIAATLPHKK